MVIYFVVTAAGLGLFILAVAGLFWLIRSGQLDDMETPALRMLHDDDPVKEDNSRE